MIALMAPGPLELMIVLVLTVVLTAITVLPFWMISTKAGFPGWISLAMLVPVLNLLFPFFLAFADWPALRHGSNQPTPHQD
jgi:hypothetical protein